MGTNAQKMRKSERTIWEKAKVSGSKDQKKLRNEWLLIFMDNNENNTYVLADILHLTSICSDNGFL